MKYFFFIFDVISIVLIMLLASFVLDLFSITVSPVFAIVSFGIVIFYGVVKSIYYFLESDSDVSE